MNIGMILEYPYPHDGRVLKEASALTNAGHAVHLLCPFDKSKQQTESEDLEHLIVHRFDYRPTPYAGGRSVRFVLTFEDRQWETAVEKFVRQNDIQVLHLHDVPLGKILVKVKERLNIPLIIDMHEYFSEGLRCWYDSTYFNLKQRTYYSLKSKLLRNPGRFERMETEVLHQANHVIAVVEDAKEQFIVRKGLPPDKITVVMNTIELDEFDGYTIDNTLVARYADSFTILYVGGFGYHRGLETVVESIPQLKKEIPNIRVVLAGDGQSRRSLQATINRLDAGEYVDLPGWIPYNEIRSYVQASDVCVVPHLKNSHTDSTIPHKIFQYMSQGRPIVVSDAVPLARIARDAHCGLIFTSGSAADFAQAIRCLHDGRTRAALGAAGKEACREVFNWTTDARRLVNLYRTLASPNAGIA